MTILKSNAERIEEIEQEISGVKSQYNITQFELDVMNSLKKLHFGSAKQNAILARIEIKVFGYSKELEPSKKGVVANV